MIRQIRGSVVESEASHVVVDVGGVGYLLFVKSNSQAYLVGENISLWTYLAVRENALDLYGFTKREELEVFELLIDLPKIGPKSAMQILNQTDLDTLKTAVRNDDPTYLSKLSGIGKKSAEKIVAGLKDKLVDEEMIISGDVGRENSASHTLDTIDALITLGYPQPEARRIVLQINVDYPEITESAEALKLALRLLSK